ncbi:DUF86 domain-containing protein [Gloeobacter morelensis MG652769]|uniref:DUF86 domain-containing protein n=2 Tax=Gloeobacter TaxID=33071 RepID=A0ABY3PQR2_9CYAN|nr:DUF86 domain-containing protein [Gloeobacter morelensis MG652769]
MFLTDNKTIDVVERCLLRISEAPVKLGSDAEALCPQVPWRDVRGIGNHLRHAYDRIDPVLIWNTVIEELPQLKAVCTAAIEKPDDVSNTLGK